MLRPRVGIVKRRHAPPARPAGADPHLDETGGPPRGGIQDPRRAPASLFMIGQGSNDQSVNPSDAEDLQAALVRAGRDRPLTMIPGAGHEDRAFSATQLPATHAFLDSAFGR
jgi:hypothetical protein